MLKFNKESTKEWNVVHSDHEPIALKLSSSTVTNKYQIVTDYIERVSEFHGQTFADWFVKLLKDCENEMKRAEVIDEAIEPIKLFSDSYLQSLNIDFSQFVDESKVKKNSILFKGDEIEEIIKLSGYLKLYSIISNNEDLKLGPKLHREVYNKFAAKAIESEVVSKIFDVIKTKTFRYKLTDSFMWDYIKTIQSKDIGTHIIEIFNFIMSNIIILCEEDKNPITYFVGVIDESVKWFLRSIYKGAIVYDDEIATEDIHSTHINNLKTYSFNDTLGRLKAVAFEHIYEKLDHENVMTINDKTDQYIIDFNNRLSTITYISPLAECLVFPLLSKMTKISYVHFKTISPEHSAVLSYYLNILLYKVFKSEYRNLFQLLDYYPESQPSINTTYKIKLVHDYIDIQNKTQNFFGFNTIIFPSNVISHFIGRVSRINFKSLLTGQKLTGIPLSKIELEMIHFYTNFFSGKLESKLDDLIVLMNNDF